MNFKKIAPVLFLLIIGLIIWFFVIKPKQEKIDKKNEKIENLKKENSEMEKKNLEMEENLSDIESNLNSNPFVGIWDVKIDGVLAPMAFVFYENMEYDIININSKAWLGYFCDKIS